MANLLKSNNKKVKPTNVMPTPSNEAIARDMATKAKAAQLKSKKK